MVQSRQQGSSRLRERLQWLAASSVVLLLGVVSAVMLALTFRIGEQHISRDVPLDTAIAELRVAVALSHLWLEEYLTGDRTVLLDRDVEGELDRAEALARSLLEGGRIDEIWTIEVPIADPAFRAEVSQLQDFLREFRAMSATRLKDPAVAGIGTELDAEYDAAFRRILAASSVLRRRVEELMMASQRRGHLYLNGILASWVMLVVLSFTGLIRIDGRRRLAESALRRSEERLSTTLRSIGEAVITTDQWGRVTFLNRMAESLTGWTFEEAAGNHVSMIRRLRADASGIAPDGAFPQALRAGEASTVGDLSLAGREGRNVAIEETAAPIFDEDGKQSGVVVVLHDVSERKRSLEALRERDARLQQSQKLEAVGRLASGLAHDINNYLAAITVECDLVQMLHGEDDRVSVRVENIVDSVFRASSLIRRLLAFSRKQPTKPAVVALDQIVDDMKGMCRRLLGEDIRCGWEVEAPLWNVKIDPASVEQILVNLLVNARDAMLDGGYIDISARNVDGSSVSPPPPLSLPDEPNGEWVVLSVADTGCGIPKELKEKIFEPFFTSKAERGSSGLGLSTVHNIVAQSGGFIRVDSEVGRGTTVEVYFPRCREERTRFVEVMHEPPRSIAACDVLLVEDNAELRESTRAYLEALGYRVTVAVDGEAALEAAQSAGSAHYEVVISDLLMPRMSGSELVRQLWCRGWSGAVVLVSAHLDEAAVSELTGRPGVAFLAKPFASAELARTIEELRCNEAPTAAAEGGPPNEA